MGILIPYANKLNAINALTLEKLRDVMSDADLDFLAEFFVPAPSMTDGYKLDHISQYVEGTELVCSNLTPRKFDLAVLNQSPDNGQSNVVWFGGQYAVFRLMEIWVYGFFGQPKDKVIAAITRRIHSYVGPDKGAKQIAAFADLHDLGYLPLRIKTLPEGTRVNANTPVYVVHNTHPDYDWLVNYTETTISDNVWPLMNAASLSEQYWLTSKRYAEKQGLPLFWAAIANHCFAARGHRGDQDAAISGMAHMLFGLGTDTLWSIDYIEKYYGGNSDNGPIGLSVNAFEHATATQRIAFFNDGCGPVEAERRSLVDITTNLYPTGILSYVADSVDFFELLGRSIKDPELNAAILNRQPDVLGLCKTVFRPDSSPKTPFEVIMGDDEAEPGSAEFKGALQLLWEAFPGTYHTHNGKTYRVLNEKVGLIYGEAITLEMQNRIYKAMDEAGWAVSNVLFGVGSWAFLKNSSRDSYGIAIKGTHSIVKGKHVPMQKLPKTDMSKASHIGLLAVHADYDGTFHVQQNCSWEEFEKGELKELFKDSKFTRTEVFEELRTRVGFVF